MCDKNETGCKRNNQSDKNHKIFISPDRNSIQKQHWTSAGDSRNICRISAVFISATICGSDRDRSTFVVVSRREPNKTLMLLSTRSQTDVPKKKKKKKRDWNGCHDNPPTSTIQRCSLGDSKETYKTFIWTC